MKKEQTSYSFSSREQNGYRAKENQNRSFAPQNYEGGLLMPLFNAMKGLIYLLSYTVGKRISFGKVYTPVSMLQFFIVILAIWVIFRADIEDNGGFTGEVSKAGFLPLSAENKDDRYIEKRTTSIIEFDESEVNAFVRRFAKVAIAENKKFNIPASVLLSVALLESEAGNNVAAKTQNNYFGATMGKKPFSTAWENWRAHSLYLFHAAQGGIGNEREDWIYFIAKGKTENANLYAWQLKSLIEAYGLHAFDEKSNLK
jgi:flagellum-specific peptidoglycan hydrolase FlgJ